MKPAFPVLVTLLFAAGCNELGSGVYLLGRCELPSGVCTEIRMNHDIQGTRRLDLHHGEEAACTLESGAYTRDERCSGTDTAKASCSTVEETDLYGLDLNFTRVRIYLADYDPSPDFGDEADDCEAEDGEFEKL